MRLLDNLFRSPTWQRRQARFALVIYTRVVLFCASLKRIENAVVFMQQMNDLQLLLPFHMLLDVAVNAAEVDDSAVADAVLKDVQDLRTRLYLVPPLTSQLACHSLVSARRKTFVCALSCG